MRKCPSNGGVRLTVVCLIDVFLWERHLSSAGTCKSVRLREVSVLWDVRLKRFYCTSQWHFRMKVVSRKAGHLENFSDLPFPFIYWIHFPPMTSMNKNFGALKEHLKRKEKTLRVLLIWLDSVVISIPRYNFGPRWNARDARSMKNLLLYINFFISNFTLRILTLNVA